MKRALWILPLALTGACSSLTPTDDPVYLRLNDIEARLIRMERVFENESLIQLASSLDQLQAETQQLRGEVETLRFETESQAERQRELYLDIDQRLQTLEQQSSQPAFPAAPGAQQNAPAGGPGSAPGGGAAGGSAQDGYDRAFGLIQARQYAEAADAFRDFLGSFPDSEFADNAQYWLAETYYVRSQFAEALPEFERVIDTYPRSDKTPDALLKIGYCNYELGDRDAASAALREVQQQFPDTTASRLATQRLDQMSREGG